MNASDLKEIADKKNTENDLFIQMLLETLEKCALKGHYKAKILIPEYSFVYIVDKLNKLGYNLVLGNMVEQLTNTIYLYYQEVTIDWSNIPITQYEYKAELLFKGTD